MFNPKCYTLINKMYNPEEAIRKNREKIREWLDSVDESWYNDVFDNIDKYINESQFPIMDIPWYVETVEGWKLITHRNKLEKEYGGGIQTSLIRRKKRTSRISKNEERRCIHKNSMIIPLTSSLYLFSRTFSAICLSFLRCMFSYVFAFHLRMNRFM